MEIDVAVDEVFQASIEVQAAVAKAVAERDEWFRSQVLDYDKGCDEGRRQFLVDIGLTPQLVVEVVVRFRLNSDEYSVANNMIDGIQSALDDTDVVSDRSAYVVGVAVRDQSQWSDTDDLSQPVLCGMRSEPDDHRSLLEKMNDAWAER